MSGRLVRASILIAAAVAFVLTVSLALADPPGNNGTVKIDGLPFDDHQDNEPHPGCLFQVDFYNFDMGNYSASVTFEGIAPTGGGTLMTDSVFIGEDHNGGGGDLDASRTYDLSARLAPIPPQKNQGWHVKLTVHADGSQGADTKHKVFWVQSCGPAGGGGGGGGGSGGSGGTGSSGGAAGAPAASPAQAVTGQPGFTG